MTRGQRCVVFHISPAATVSSMITTTGQALSLRRIAAGLVALEAAALLSAGAWFAVAAVMRDDATAMSAATSVSALAAGGVLAWAARALWRGAAWPRGLAITWQVLQCAAGATLIEWSLAIGVASIAVAVAAGAALVADARREGKAAMSGDEAPELTAS